MRRKIVAGNWKMNLDAGKATALFLALEEMPKYDVDVIIFPPAIYLQEFHRTTKGINYLGIQNVFPKEEGAFTGEISISQAKNCGATYVLVGHSERRNIFGESAEFLKEKINACLTHELTPIFCCGEPLEEREASTHLTYVKKQLEESLFHVSKDEILKTIIAYEPVWAIGTGLTATSEQAESMHQSIREWIAAIYGTDVAQQISILYGGSCNASNAKELFSCPNVDGGLIGGASLDRQSFEDIMNSF